MLLTEYLDDETCKALQNSKPEIIFLYLTEKFLFYRAPPRLQVDFSTLTDHEFRHFTRFSSSDIITVSDYIGGCHFNKNSTN